MPILRVLYRRIASGTARVRSLAAITVVAMILGGAGPAIADVQVNSPDNNSPTLGNYTTESETSVARSGSLVVIGYNTSRQAGIVGGGAWNTFLGFAYSRDGGMSFTDGGFLPWGSYQLDGDPTLAFDGTGTLYYGSLLESGAASYIGVSQSTSTSPAVAFADPVPISGPSSNSGGFEDKEFLAIDTTGGTHNGRVYVGWSDFPNPDKSRASAEFAASTSTAPLTFGPTIKLAGVPKSFQTGVIPVVAPDGSVYVAWVTLASSGSSTINLVKSKDGGATFKNPDPSDPNKSKTVASFAATAGALTTGAITVRTRSMPYLAIDNTPPGSPTRGNMYVVFQAQPSASSATPRSEVFFTSSADGGQTWSTPRDITTGAAATIGADTTTNDNWFPAISVSPVTGHIKVLLYSRREDAANQQIRIYEAGSTDAGMTWYNRAFSAASFSPSVGYDSIFAPTYMGDYEYAFADANGLLGAWGDTRSLCTPPVGASAPCSPAGRGDQDVWSNVESDVTGTDLAITPWGEVTGVGPLWQSPDIFVVNSVGTQVNAELGVINQLQARIRDLGNVDATAAVVRFRFAPWYASIPDSAFETIGTVTANVPAGGASQTVPVNWDLTNLSDTNGGIWPAPISTFSHFCVRVDIEYASDINLSNNDAQTNFFDVTTSSGPMAPIRFIVGNPLSRPVNIQLIADTSRTPIELRPAIPTPVVSVPAKPAARTQMALARGPVVGAAMPFNPNELQIGTIVIKQLPLSITRYLRHDLVLNIDSVVNGRVVSGFSVLLARANVPPGHKATIGGNRVVSRQVAQSVPRAAPSPRTFALTAPVAAAGVSQSIARYLAEQRIAVVQNDPARGLVSSGAIPLSNEQLLAAIAPEARINVPEGAAGKYFVSFKTTPDETQGGVVRSRIVVSVRIIVLLNDIDSPLGGRFVPSNGSLEQHFLNALNARLR